ncbi:MAG: NAD(P)-dependent oxidoreductase [Clostridia bacterium]
MAKRIGMIGLGIMGSAMSHNLLAAGVEVVGFDVSPDAMRRFKRDGGTPARSAADVLRSVDVALTSLPSAAALHQVCAEVEGKRSVIAETSTLPIEDKVKARNTLAKKGITLLDCPLSGTGAQARKKDLVVLASGERKGFARLKPFLPGFSKSHYYLGEFGNGSKMKFVANLLVAIHNVAAGEAFALGMKAGLSPKDILEVISPGAGSSRMFEVRGPQMVAGKYGDATMKVEVWQKDMKVIGEFAAKLGVATPLFSASAPIYNAAMSQGFAKEDTAAVCAVLERMSGVRRKRNG